MDNAPSNYNPAVGMAATGTHSQDSPADVAFVTSLKGIFRLCEVILAMVGIITSSLSRPGFAIPASSWCMTVSIFTFIIFTTTYFLWVFRVLPKLSPGIPITFSEFVCIVIFCGFYFVGAVVASVYGSINSAMIATAVFYYLTTILCAVDAFFHHRYWMVSAEGPNVCGKKVGGADAWPSPTTTAPGTAGPYSVGMDNLGGPGPPPDFSPPPPDIGPSY